jgi:hypothetical protein
MEFPEDEVAFGSSLEAGQIGTSGGRKVSFHGGN